METTTYTDTQNHKIKKATWLLCLIPIYGVLSAMIRYSKTITCQYDFFKSKNYVTLMLQFQLSALITSVFITFIIWLIKTFLM